MKPVLAPEHEIAAISSILRELRLPAGEFSLLLAHAAAVAEDADRLGLVAERGVQAVLARHVADSLLFALVRAPQPGETWVDVGSGAGFPGMVLACCYPETSFTLVEPQQRRAGFLDLTATTLGLENVTVSQAKASDLEPGFDVAVARAIAEPALALETMRRLVLPGGAVVLAVGESAHLPVGVTEFDAARPGVDSPGRFFVVDETAGGA